jgi:uncharacterized BrkB/YihY/UPF0761 family membrane protein
MSGMRRGGERWLARLRRWTTRVRRAAPALDLLWELGYRFRQRNGTVLAGHLAYRFFIWLAPMSLILVAGLGFSAGPLDLVQYATEFDVSREASEDAVDQARAGRIQLLAIGIPVLAIASWGLIRGMHYAFAQAWALRITPRKRIVTQVGITMVSGFAVVILYFILALVQRQGPLFAVLGAAGSLLLTGFALWLVCWVMPRGTNRRLDLVPGAALGALGFAGLHVFGALYLPARIASSTELYGAIGVAVGLLFYIVLHAYLLVGTAFVNSVWSDRREIIAGRPWVIDPEALPGWLQPAVRWIPRRAGPGERP